MTANREDPGVANKLLTADPTADPPWPEPPSDEQIAAWQEDDYALGDDSTDDIFYDAVESLSPFADGLTGDGLNDSDSHARQINGKGGVPLLPPGLCAPVVPEDSDSSGAGSRAVRLAQPEADSGCYPSDELWLNANQVLAGEEEHAILGRQNKCSDDTVFAGSHNEGSLVSSYPLAMIAAIGSPVDDSWFRMPPVITWPAVDSWSDSHSGIAHIVLSGPEEPPAIVIQTLEVMAIKDKEGGPRYAQEDTETAQQMCLVTAGQDNSELTAERGLEKDQTLLKIQGGDPGVHYCGDKADSETALSEEHSSQVTSGEARCSNLHFTEASQNLCELEMTDILTSTEYTATTVISDSAEDITPMWEGMSIGEEDMEICFEKRIPSQGSGEEKVSKSECQNSSEEPQTPELETGALWKVTGDALFPPRVDAEEGVRSGRGDERLTVSGFSGEPSAAKPSPRRSAGAQSADAVLQGAAGRAPAQTHRYPRPEETGSAARREDKPLRLNLQRRRNDRFDGVTPLASNCQRNIRFNTDAYATLKGDRQQARILETERNRTFDRSGAFLSENKREEPLDVGEGKAACGDFPSGDHEGKIAFCCAQSADEDLFKPSSPGERQRPLSLDKRSHETTGTVSSLTKDFSKLLILAGNTFVVCEEVKTAYITLDLNDPVGRVTWPGLEDGNRIDYTSALEHMKTNKTRCVGEINQKEGPKMPQKTSRTSSGSKISTGNKSREKPASHQEKSKHAATQASKKQETPIPESPVTCESPIATAGSKAAPGTEAETKEMTEKCTKSRGKKKKKQPQHSSGKVEAEALKEATCGAQPQTAGLAEQAGSTDKLSVVAPQTNRLPTQNRSEVKDVTAKVKRKGTVTDEWASATDTDERRPTGLAKLQGEHVLKRRHLFEAKAGQRPSESKPQKASLPVKEEEQAAAPEAGQRRAYSEVVKQTPQAHKEVPKVLQDIRAEKLSDELGGISLQCQFSAVSMESSVLWTREGAVLEQAERSAGDERLLSFTISKPSSKDLGRYQCCLSCPLGTLTSEFYLTSDVLSELLPSQDHHAAEVVEGVEEDVKCTPLLFKEDFLSEQYFGENQPTSILTEQAHFGEGMYRRAFRTKLLGGMLPVFSPGHPCVLKVHNAISQGTRNNDELIRKNYSLAVEECCVQNTAREYIKAYTTVARSAEDFGEVPEIIPILLVHRPSSDIPYATLEEELMGDFVKYSVKDGKEINLTRRDSEPGQKCCAFQHWVYDKTEGNLLVTDMQGVGMKLTDVGIATPKKGYKGFRGNCATSFIDQFKALHQCNKFCQLLGLKSLQPSQAKPRRTPPGPKPQPQPKKKPFAVNLKSKS
ncbi:alpha-protein kinase 2 isoform X2 [Conger conger]|uniref:alpha-protein kinase 2 isoform X2 n=1 Tax=Conger conger TaxID=82655 RepID=UPI002A5A8CDB|nr:alpha-protein kinase 2 isoform X2 [Conger conger]